MGLLRFTIIWRIRSVHGVPMKPHQTSSLPTAAPRSGRFRSAGRKSECLAVNRKNELRSALCSAEAQTARPEIVVPDDGSTDGTADMVRADFARVVLHQWPESKGYIVRRNEGARIAQGDIIFSIDDDAAFSTPNVVEQTLRDFADPRIGAVAIPYMEPHKENRLMKKAPDAEQIRITNCFIGRTHALRQEMKQTRAK